MGAKRPRKTKAGKDAPPPEFAHLERIAHRNGVPERPVFNLGTRASQIKEERTEWLCDPWIALRTLSIVAGEPACGKSTFGAYLMSLAERAVVLPGREDSVGAKMIGRLLAHKVNLDKVLILNDAEYTLPLHKGRIADVVSAERAKLLWIDPLDSYMGQVSENDGQAVRDYLESFVWIGQKTGAAVVGVRHPGKMAGNVLPGSRQWGAVPRIVLHLMVDDGPPKRRICRGLKDSNGAQPTPQEYKLAGKRREPPVWTWGETLGDAEVDDLAEVDDKVDRWKIDHAVALLRMLLAEGRVEAAQVYKAGDMERLSDRIMRRAARRLGVQYEREGNGVGHRCFWRLPD